MGERHFRVVLDGKIFRKCVMGRFDLLFFVIAWQKERMLHTAIGRSNLGCLLISCSRLFGISDASGNSAPRSAWGFIGHRHLLMWMI
jgi:hypothetical protein